MVKITSNLENLVELISNLKVKHKTSKPLNETYPKQSVSTSYKDSNLKISRPLLQALKSKPNIQWTHKSITQRICPLRSPWLFKSPINFHPIEAFK